MRERLPDCGATRLHPGYALPRNIIVIARCLGALDLSVL